MLWSGQEADSLVQIGGSQSGFTLDSGGLPTIREASLEARYLYEAPSGEVGPEDKALAQEAYRQARVAVQTVGPLAPPAVFEARAFFAEIQDLRTRAEPLGWLQSGSALSELDGELGNVDSALAAGSISAARNAIALAITNVESNSCADFDCPGKPFSSEGRALIALNLQYLLGQLPEVSQPLVATAWIGLKNSDDQGTAFDLRTELYHGGTLIAQGLTRCITGVTRNANQAKEVSFEFDAVPPVTVAAGDVLKLLTRIGTNPDDTKCPGHNNATGLRLYYDAATRTSGFGGPMASGASASFFLHLAGSSQVFNATTPTATTAHTQDSAGVNFTGGNAWKEIGSWTRVAP
jgi:hypothetical protein